MPTKRAVFVLIFSFVLLIGAWASKLVLLYFSFSACIALLLISFVFSKFLFLNLNIERDLPLKVYEGEKVSVEIKVRSRMSLFDCSMQIEDTFTATEKTIQKVIYLNGLAKGNLKFSYQEICYKRGKYRIGPFKIRIFEPLGMFYLVKVIPVYSELMVYPKVFAVKSLPFILGHLAPRYGHQTTRISGNYEEFFGIREYQTEDGWRRIHWRSTARSSELMVKHFEQSSQWKATLVLDAGKNNNVGFGRNNTFEYSISVLASLNKYLLYNNASFGFLTNTKQPIQISIAKGRDHFYKILDKMAVIDADGSLPLQQLLARYQWAIPDSSSLIIASNNFDTHLVKFLNIMKVQKNVGIVPVIMNAPSFAVARPDKAAMAAREKAVRKTCNTISSQIYVINKGDSLKMHFMK